MAKEYEIKSSDDELLTLPTSWMEGVSRPFSDCTSLTGVIIPEGVTEIDDHAFEGCTSLSSVIIPSSVTKIGKFAFARCISLTTISIPGNVADIEVCAFVCCTSLKEIRYGGTKERWKAIKKGSFWYKNTYVQEVFCSDGTVELPSYSIEDGVLDCWYHLVSEVIIPEGVTKIGREAFSGCRLLASVSIPEGVTEIGNQAFNECETLSSVIIPCSVTKINPNAFRDCTSLKEIRYGGTKEQWNAVEKKICWYKNTRVQEVFCFDDTMELPAYIIEDGVLKGWYRLVPEAVIPECVMKIDDFAFYDCMLLSSVVIPESVTKIGYSAFSNCTLRAYVNIIGSLTEIENYAFGSCSSLKEIHYGGTKEQWKAVKKEPEWNDGVPAKCVVCTDGTVKL